MSTEPPAGWYPDPTGARFDRWWDGRAWTDATAAHRSATAANDATTTAPPSPAEVGHGSLSTSLGEPVSATREPARPAPAEHGSAGAPAGGAPPKPPRRGTAVVIALVAILLGGVVGVVIVSTGGDGADVTADDEASGATDEADDAALPQDAPDDAGDDADADADETPEDDPPASADPGDDERSELEATRTVDLDGACTAEVDAGLSVDELRAWQLPDCDWAPIDPGPDGTWVLVVTSLNGDDFDAPEAEQRARAEGLPGRVLWSTHYGSLNPDLWVVYDGPFSSEATASEAAYPGSYPRKLSDDPEDRYCMAADGCQGERSD